MTMTIERYQHQQYDVLAYVHIIYIYAIIKKQILPRKALGYNILLNQSNRIIPNKAMIMMTHH